MLLPQNNGFESFDQEGSLEQFVFSVQTIQSSVEGQMAMDIFDQDPAVEGLVVMENNSPVGIIMRTSFYQRMGTLYGHSLYMKRPVSLLMDQDIMKVEVTDNISRIGIQAMSREQSKLYDYILVYKNKVYLGVISIRLFLVELSKRNEAQINVLKNQQQKLLNAHEQEILLRKDLEYQSASVRNLLDHADQGFFWFGKDLLVKKECSYKCMTIFNKSIGDLNYLDLVAPYFEKDKTGIFQMVFDSYFKNNSPVTDNVYLMLLPSDCVIGEKNIHFEYRRIESNGQKAVMVILNDITEKVSLEKAMEEDRNKQRILVKAFSCQAQIKQMLEEFHEIFSGGYRNFFQEDSDFSSSLNELFRAVHTFKGDFAQYGFISASNRLHAFEDALLSVVQQGESAAMADVDHVMVEAEPEKMLEEDLNIIYEVLGNSYFDQSEIISFPKAKLMEIIEIIRSTGDPLDRAAVIRLIEGLKRRDVKVFLEQYRDYLEYLSNRVLKNIPIYLIEGDDIEIDVDQYGDFFKSLVHIFRNIMDHGIETDEERFECGKDEKGLVECRVSRLDDKWFTLCISDDGRGIDLKKIKEKAIESNTCSADELNQMTKEEICNLIFADHFSTKDCADVLSGRGVGMPAFQRACAALGATVEISTEEKKGTSFLIKLPYAV